MNLNSTLRVALLAFVAAGCCALPQRGMAQDIHFSQFYLSPLNLNPAMTGVIGCEMRFTGIYRNQWASILKNNSFRTYSASFDGRVNVGKYDYVGLGGTLWADRVGSPSFGTVQLNGSASYLKRLGGFRSNEQYLVAGAQLGVTQRSIDVSKLIYGDQWDGENSYIPGSSAEQPFDPNFMYADVGAGVMYFVALDRRNTSNVYGGIAFHHLNRANMSFSRRTFDALYSRFTLHAGAELALNEKIGLVPGFVYMKQGPSFQTNFGSSVRFKFGKVRTSRQAFSLGLWTRLAGHYQNAFTSDALILSTRVDVNDLTLGFSYDLNISQLRAATNSNGAFEFALGYKICRGGKRNLGCPTF